MLGKEMAKWLAEGHIYTTLPYRRIFDLCIGMASTLYCREAKYNNLDDPYFSVFVYFHY